VRGLKNTDNKAANTDWEEKIAAGYCKLVEATGAIRWILFETQESAGKGGWRGQGFGAIAPKKVLIQIAEFFHALNWIIFELLEV
jgi:hypothetical protein